MKNRNVFLLLALVCAATVFPFLGESLFQSKGEPREAIVAYSMLESGNWILPINNGGDIAYKPPFFHWCIALVSSLTGQVNEYTSRFPSALAMVVMVLSTCLFYMRRKSAGAGFITGLVTLTAFEVHRAGWACRVDMVLTVCIVLALFQLYRWYERAEKGFPVWAVLWMGLATLTKGPVGIVLPCLVCGLFLLAKGRPLARVVRQMVPVALASCVLPALWYVAAYRQGGANFIDLVMEENFGRFMGKMSYASHEHSVFYNFATVLAGYLPYTLLLVLALPMAFRKLKACSWPRHIWASAKESIRRMDDTRLFTLMSIVVIFVFYCIPKSKRSTYLLPIYPFMAYYLTEFLLYLVRQKPALLRLYGTLLSIVAFLPILAFVLIKSGAIFTLLPGVEPASGLGQILQVIYCTPIDWMHGLYIALPIAAIVWFCRSQRTRKAGLRTLLYPVIAVVLTIHVSLDSVFIPEVMNAKSDKPIAEEVRARVPEGNLYFYIAEDMMRYFTINFYLGNRVLMFENELPQAGYLLIGPNDWDEFVKRHPNYNFTEVYRSPKKSCDTKQPVLLYHFNKN